MYRQSPGRNQRSKGIKVKHILQICLLLAICFWLIYQVKLSHDKKREFDENEKRSLLQRESSDDFVKLGRKGIGARLEGTILKNVKLDEPEEEEDAGGELEENKNEEDELDRMKAEGKRDVEMGRGDDEIDEDEQEKSDEVDREEDGEEREDGVEDEAQVTESEDAHSWAEKDISVEESDHDGDDEGSVDEAREEHYKADDASSAVTHNTEVAATENEDQRLENSNEKVLEEEMKENSSEETKEGEKRKGLEVGVGEMAGDDHQSDMTTSENKEGGLDNSRDVAPRNNEVTEGFNHARLMSNSTDEVMTENHVLTTPNVTEEEPELANNSATPTANGTSAQAYHFQINTLDLVNKSIVNVESSAGNISLIRQKI